MGIFTGNQKIRSFNELKYFKNATLTIQTFYNCTSLEEVDGGNLLQISGMNMFRGTSLRKATIRIKGNITSTFRDLSSTSLDLSGVNVSEVKTFLEAISYCPNLEEITLFKNCGTASDASLHSFIYSNPKLKKIDIRDFDTSLVTIFRDCFKLNTALEVIEGIGDLNVSNATNMQSLFQQTNIKHLDLHSWNTSNVTNMMYVFHACPNLEYVNISGWDTSSVTNQTGMFSGVSGFSLTKLTSLIIDSSFFNCVIRESNPLTTIDIVGATAWVNKTEITNMLNALPDLVNGGYTATSATIKLSAQTKNVINSNSLASIATSKGWTIA